MTLRDEDRAPLDTAAMQRVGGALGSHPAGLYEDARGRRWYVKTVESPDHARNEWLAAQLYALAGAPTLHYRRCRAPDQVATAWQTLQHSRLSRFSEAERRQARHWLGVHAWLANWDAVGFEGDNQGVATDGTVLTLDVGGALRYRAQGDPKGVAFGTRVGEWDRLRRDPDNPHARRLFADMDAAERQAAGQVVTALPAAMIQARVLRHGGTPALAQQLLARQADLAHRLPG
ncbi:hypothetical protein [Ideonella dechloratans]|uniref:hypothetical protein n=1 Tax=Ideonella dechloratans TaxID=36863 RepID=UPI0035B168A1